MGAAMLALLLLAGPPAGLENGSFELDADGDGVPDGWATSGDAGVTQRLERVPEGDGFAARLTCTAFRASSPASHAMLAQVGKVTLRRDQWYRLRLRIRGEAVAAGAVQVAVSDMNGWSNCGLQGGLVVQDEWRERELIFRATREVSTTSRLQFWFGSTGTVWFDDLSLEPIDPPRRRYLERVPPSDAPNLVPNGGFELGAAGWGSITDVPGWGGNLNTLYGEVRRGEGRGGGAALRIDLTPDRIPSVSFDYFDPFLIQAPFPLAGNRGWMGVEPGQPYTLSAWVRSEPAGVPVILRGYSAGAGRAHGNARAGGDWTRVSLTFRPASDQVFCAVGPDLRQHTAGGTFWVDDVQLVAGEAAIDAPPRTDRAWRLEPVHGIVEVGQPIQVIVQPSADGLRWRLTDFADRVVADGTGQPRLEGLPAGFYRLAAVDEPMVPPLPLRLAVIQPNRRDDTICGMNHAYPTDDLLALSRRIGLGWFRDWSFQWRLVEPEPGRWDWSAPDAQVDRVLRQDLRVLALLPFPSAIWSSTSTAAPGRGESATLDIIARAPRNLDEFARYVREAVAHLRGRIDAVEIFNEPIYTHYSLPRAAGYTVEDYVRHLRVAAAAAREANPGIFVVGGIQAGPENLTAELIAAGGLEPIDALSLHSYPGVGRPELFVDGLAALRANMAAAGKADLPLWWTEGAYYADDDPAFEPYQAWLTPVPDERLQALFMVRLNVVLCGANTRRIIYHSGTPGDLNDDDMAGVFFEYDGQPRKLVPALAAFNTLLGPDFTTRGRLPAPEGVYAYAFESDGRQVLVAWSLSGRRLFLAPPGWQVLDLFGNPLTSEQVTLSEMPVYLVGPAGAQEPVIG